MCGNVYEATVVWGKGGVCRMIIAKDGVTVTQMGNRISCSDGSVYILTGRMLTGPGGVVSYNVGNISEAVGIVLGMHGGRMF